MRTRLHRTCANDTVHEEPGRYDTPAKNAVRQHLLPLFTEGEAPPLVRRVRPWFFPGSISTEYDGYRQAGIPDANMRGFEWNDLAVPFIRAYAPTLPVYEKSLGAFLGDSRHSGESCDWANLDFDGNAFSFRDEILGVVRRMRTDAMPRFACSSFLGLHRAHLREAIVLAIACRAAVPDAFVLGTDLRQARNHAAGLAAEEQPSWHAIIREVAFLFLLTRAFGGRSFGGRAEDATASAFRTAVDRELRRFRTSVIEDAMRAFENRGVIPEVPSDELRALLAERTIPLAVGEWLRFTYLTANHKRMWTWMFRFEPLRGRRVTLTEWLRTLLVKFPPLHAVDVRGIPMSRDGRICRYCPIEVPR